MLHKKNRCVCSENSFASVFIKTPVKIGILIFARYVLSSGGFIFYAGNPHEDTFFYMYMYSSPGVSQNLK